jgi:hypothetical protein
MKAEKAPKERQSRFVLGLGKAEGENDEDGGVDDHQPPNCVVRHRLFPFIIRVRPRRLAMAAVMAMVHEEMHERTRQYEQPRQRAQNMRGVLGQ